MRQAASSSRASAGIKRPAATTCRRAPRAARGGKARQTEHRVWRTFRPTAECAVRGCPDGPPPREIAPEPRSQALRVAGRSEMTAPISGPAKEMERCAASYLEKCPSSPQRRNTALWNDLPRKGGGACASGAVVEGRAPLNRNLAGGRMREPAYAPKADLSRVPPQPATAGLLPLPLPLPVEEPWAAELWLWWNALLSKEKVGKCSDVEVWG